jgi:hypothetical protein
MKVFGKHNRGAKADFLLCNIALSKTCRFTWAKKRMPLSPGTRLCTMNEQDKLNDLLAELKAEHRDLDDAIHALSQRGVPDMVQIQRLKKRKLVLRDEIMRIESKLLPDIIA